jgi:hypothetical protein
MLPDGYMFDVRAGTQRGAVMAEKRRNPLPFGIKSYWGLTLDFRHPFHQVDSFQGPVLGFGRRNNNSHSINMYVFNPEMTQRAEVWSHMVLTMLGPEGEPEFVRTNS